MLKEVPNHQWQKILVSHLEKAKKPLVVILGPTASGKTAFSIEIAKWVNSLPLGGRVSHSAPSSWPRGERGSKEFLYPLSRTLSPRERESQIEIINADSRQLYKYMDTGTAKITEEEMYIDVPTPSPQSSPHGRGRVRIPHHLFSVLDPKEKVTVGWYKKEAERVIDDVLARGNIPILVGGSMLYISAVTDGYVFTGRGGKHIAPIPYDLLIFGMQCPREELVKRIEERTVHSLSPRERVRVRGSWITEVESLLARGYQISDPGMKSHGYREIAQTLLVTRSTLLDETTMQNLYETITVKTRQYAKRQMTWWKGDERIQWIPWTSPLH